MTLDELLAAHKDGTLAQLFRKHGTSPFCKGTDIIAILKVVCEIGQPLLDTFCPLIKGEKKP